MLASDFVKTVSIEEHTATKTVYAGSNELIESNVIEFGQNTGFFIKKRKYVPSLFKAVDEILVNSTDHFINCINRQTDKTLHTMFRGTQRFVTKIDITLDKDRVPQSIEWNASDTGAENAQKASAMMLAFWDGT